MINNKNFPGLSGFIWWTGIVEGRKDPLMMGRIQIRMFGWHTEVKKLIPSEELLWAQAIYTGNSSNDTYCPKEGDVVFGFFIDGDAAQQPFYFGRFPDIPEVLYSAKEGFSDPGTRLAERPRKVASRIMTDGEGLEYTDKSPTRYPNPLHQPTTSRFARNESLEETPLPFIKSNIIKSIYTAAGKKWDEPEPDYAAEYPYNDSKESESGHYFDIDDTRRKERITMTHRTGTMQEMRRTGSIHRKDMKHAIHLVHGTAATNVRGNLWITTEKWTRYKSKGQTNVEINADAKINVAGHLNLNVGKDLVINCGGRIYIGAVGEFFSSSEKKYHCGEDTVRSYSDMYGVLPIMNGIPTMEVITLHGGVAPFPSGVGLWPVAYSNVFVGNLAGNAATAFIAEIIGGAAPVFGFDGSLPSPEIVDWENPIEARALELNVGCGSGKDKTPEEEFQDKMDALLAAITAPTGGGAGAKWCWTMPDGTKGCIATHHATSDAEILKYMWCLGAVSVEGTENSTGITTKYSRPSGYKCPL